MSIASYIDIIDELFEENAVPSNVKAMEAYMKNKFLFKGLKSEARKKAFTIFWQSSKAEMENSWKELVQELWNQPEREYQYFAQDLIGKFERKLNNYDLPLIESLICRKSWWDSVDFLATHGIGTILRKHPELRRNKAREYMSSDNMWLQRTSLIFQLTYKKDTDSELLFELIDKTTGSKEFFINKASGWALRQLSKYERELVAKFIESRSGQLSGLTIREGSKYI